MYKVIIFNLRKIFMSLGTYLIPVIGIIMFAAISLPTLLTNKTKETLIFKQGLLSYAIIFIISLTFIAFIVIHFFKTPHKDGSSLIIMAKDISRNKYIASNMISTMIMVLYFSIVFSIGSLIVVSFGPNSTFIQRLKFSTSIFIASIIIMAIFASIIILYSIFSNERLIMVLTILTAVILPLLSFTVKPLFNKPFTSGNEYMVSKLNKNNVSVEQGLSLDMTKWDIYNQGPAYKEYQTSKYNRVVWLDAWYQLSGLYTSLFQKDNQSNKIWKRSTQTLQINNQDLSINLNGKTYALLTKTKNVNQIKKTRVSELTDQYLQTVQAAIKTTPIMNFEQQLLFSNVVLKNVTTGNFKQSAEDFFTTMPTKPEELLSQFTIQIDLYSIQTYQKLIKNKIIIPSNISTLNPKDFFSAKGYRTDTFLIPNGTIVNTFITQDYINIKWLIMIWVGIVIVTNIGTFYIFTKLKFN